MITICTCLNVVKFQNTLIATAQCETTDFTWNTLYIKFQRLNDFSMHEIFTKYLTKIKKKGNSIQGILLLTQFIEVIIYFYFKSLLNNFSYEGKKIYKLLYQQT